MYIPLTTYHLYTVVEVYDGETTKLGHLSKVPNRTNQIVQSYQALKKGSRHSNPIGSIIYGIFTYMKTIENQLVHVGK